LFADLSEKANEYPQKYHWKIPMNELINTIHIIDNALFRLANPEYKNAKPGIIIQISDEAIENNNMSLSL
jgi:hypothetical protein